MECDEATGANSSSELLRESGSQALKSVKHTALSVAHAGGAGAYFGLGVVTAFTEAITAEPIKPKKKKEPKEEKKPEAAQRGLIRSLVGLDQP